MAVQKFSISSMESHSFSTKFLIHAAYHFIYCTYVKSHSFQRLDLDSSAAIDYQLATDLREVATDLREITTGLSEVATDLREVTTDLRETGRY